MSTDFLFVRPHAWFGVTRMLDIAGSFDRYNVSRTPGEADARAMYSDWRMVGEDLVDAIISSGAGRNVPRKTSPPEQLPLQLR